MKQRWPSPSSKPSRVELGALRPGGVLVAERRLVEIDGELLPLRLLTIEDRSPKGERSARSRRKPFAR